jgi:negative regulator of sigma E activity
MNTPGTDQRGTDLRGSDERENLCALFDGELQGDAARFALKRLGHDAEWRQACGRWQLYGDVLRGQATAIAGSSFADRVAQAIAQEPTLAAVVSTATQSRARRPIASRRGWIGGALAASVAVAALFVTRPFSNDGAPAVGDGAATQVAAATAAPTTPAAPVTVPEPAIPSAPDHEAGLGAAAVAAVEVPRRAAERRSTRSQNQRAALRASRQTRMSAPATAVASAAPLATHAAIASTDGAAVTAKPFQPEHPEVASRPWPRAVLPQYSGSAGLTASYGSGASSPSFYPFEPSLAAPATNPAAAEAESTAPQR